MSENTSFFDKKGQILKRVAEESQRFFEQHDVTNTTATYCEGSPQRVPYIKVCRGKEEFCVLPHQDGMFFVVSEIGEFCAPKKGSLRENELAAFVQATET